MLEAEIIMQDVVKRKRRVLGPAHPSTLHAERALAAVAAARGRDAATARGRGAGWTWFRRADPVAGFSLESLLLPAMFAIVFWWLNS